jgi:tetratricopeptide (TPR) repeat protein
MTLGRTPVKAVVEGAFARYASLMKALMVRVAIALALALSPGLAFAACKLEKIADLPVTMSGAKALVATRINGADAVFVADSGAFFSQISPGAAAQYALKLGPAPFGLTVRGLGGEERVAVTTVKTFTIAGAPLRDVQFIVGGSEVGHGAAGLLGQNILGLADTEYDLANGVIRLIKSSGCNDPILYWAGPNQHFGVVELEPTTPFHDRLYGHAKVNGVRVKVLFDTGAFTSLLTLSAARRAGVDPTGPGVIDGGVISGVGRRRLTSLISPVASFEIGGEEIKQTRLRVADAGFSDHDMLLGADFFLSHRIYVAKAQHRLYFTYNGGPVFNLSVAPQAAPAPGPAGSPDAKPAAEPRDPEALSRRGSAFAARRDFVSALADLDRACALAPKEPRYFAERGRIHLQNQQPLLAMADFNQALALKPDDVPSLLLRADLRLVGHDRSAAVADLDAADKAAPPSADARLALGDAYLRAENETAAIHEFDLWIKTHPDDSRRAVALTSRCWARAVSNQALDLALADCDAAVRLDAKTTNALAVRGLVRLRQGDYPRAIADYDAALLLRPRSAWALYGRGIARLRTGQTGQGQADLAAARAASPKIADEAKARGLTP